MSGRGRDQTQGLGDAGGNSVSPLALRLQQVWLHTQVSKDSVSPASSSSGSSQVDSPGFQSTTSPDSLENPHDGIFFDQSELTTQNDGVRSQILSNIASTLMDEDMDEQNLPDEELDVCMEILQDLQDLVDPNSFLSCSVADGNVDSSPFDFTSEREFSHVTSFGPEQSTTYPEEGPENDLSYYLNDEDLSSVFQLSDLEESESFFSSASNDFGVDYQFIESSNDFPSPTCGNGGMATDIQVQAHLQPKSKPEIGSFPWRAQMETAYQKVVQRLGLHNPELIDQLVECARTVANGDVIGGNAMIERLSKEATYGNATQRLVYFFLQGLMARISATGGMLSTVDCCHQPSTAEALNIVKVVVDRTPFYRFSGGKLTTVDCCHRPSTDEALNIVKVVVDRTPFYRLPFFFSNQVILSACQGYDKIHIIEFGTTSGYGFQWPPLIRDIAKCSPAPQLRMTFIDYRCQAAVLEKLRDICRCLMDCAAAFGVNLKTHAIEEKWESVNVALQQDELLIVNTLFQQQNLFDETVIPECPRKLWLKKVASMKPALFIQGVLNLPETAPFFMTRFLEIIPWYATLMDVLETCLGDNAHVRELFERRRFGRRIVNVVACEGLERTERSETYKRWHSRMEDAGFVLPEIDANILRASQEIVNSYSKDFYLTTDGGWLLFGWKEQVLQGFSAWTFQRESRRGRSKRTA